MSGFYRPASRTACRLVDGEMVIVRLPEGEMTVLNSSGSLLWSSLNGERDLSMLQKLLADAHRLTSLPDIKPFLDELRAKGLIDSTVLPSPVLQPIPPAPPASPWQQPEIRVHEPLEALAGFCGSSFDGVDPCRVDVVSCDALFD